MYNKLIIFYIFNINIVAVDYTKNILGEFDTFWFDIPLRKNQGEAIIKLFYDSLVQHRIRSSYAVDIKK